MEEECDIDVPRPKSPPELYGKRRRRELAAKVVVLETEIGFLQEELKSIETLQPVSSCIKEVADYVVTTPEPLITTCTKAHKSCGFWKWLRSGSPCFNMSWVCCCCGCSFETPSCCDTCSSPDCCSCSLPKCNRAFKPRCPSCLKACFCCCTKCPDCSCFSKCCFSYWPTKCSCPKVPKCSSCGCCSLNCIYSCCQCC